MNVLNFETARPLFFPSRKTDLSGIRKVKNFFRDLKIAMDRILGRKVRLHAGRVELEKLRGLLKSLPDQISRLEEDLREEKDKARKDIVFRVSRFSERDEKAAHLNLAAFKTSGPIKIRKTSSTKKEAPISEGDFF